MRKLTSTLLAGILGLSLIGVPSPASASGDHATITSKRLVWKTPKLYALLNINGEWSEVTIESYALCSVGEAWPSCTSWWAGYHRSPYRG